MSIETLSARLRSSIIDVPDFPKPGIVFKDITPVLADASLRQGVTDALYDSCCSSDITAVAGMESRGFLFGVPLADALGVPFIPVRKPGKLPRDVYRQTYELEYGTDELQVHRDALDVRDRVVIVDDLLATGGTAEAAAKLVQKSGAEVVRLLFVIELTALGGHDRLQGYDVRSIVSY